MFAFLIEFASTGVETALILIEIAPTGVENSSHFDREETQYVLCLSHISSKFVVQFLPCLVIFKIAIEVALFKKGLSSNLSACKCEFKDTCKYF